MYWGFLVVASLVGSPAQHSNAPLNDSMSQASKVAGGPPPTILAPNTNEAERQHRARYEATCNSGDDKRDSDLCAQWKAADAAAESAKWTYWGNWIGGISGLSVLVALYLAFQSNRIARDTAKRQLRAYVTLEKYDIAIQKTKENTYVDGRLEVVWKNTGQTPATNVSDRLAWTTSEGPLPSDYEFAQESPEGPCDNLALGPGQDFDCVSAHTLGAEDFAAIRDGKLRAFVWSSVNYTDAFGERRRSEVAAEMVVRPLKNGQVNIAFNAIPQHNGIDEDCMRPPQ